MLIECGRVQVISVRLAMIGKLKAIHATTEVHQGQNEANEPEHGSCGITDYTQGNAEFSI